MTFDAFVSYRRSDFAFAEGIFELCSAFGLNVFLDKRSLRLGRAWEATLLDALQNSRTLLVLWSRSAANSSYMQREWRLVPPSCQVIPVRLDSSPLPDDLAHYQGLDGFGISGRILSRSLELTREQKLSQTEANRVLLAELAEEGVELEPKQKRAVLDFVAVATSSTLLLALEQTRFFVRELGGTLLSAKGGAGLLGASLAFGAGAFFASSGAAPTPSLSPTVQASLPAPETAETCPDLLRQCQQSASDQTTTTTPAAPTGQRPVDTATPALRQELNKMDQELKSKEQALRACLASSQAPSTAPATPSTSRTMTPKINTAATALSKAAATPAVANSATKPAATALPVTAIMSPAATKVPSTAALPPTTTATTPPPAPQ